MAVTSCSPATSLTRPAPPNHEALNFDALPFGQRLAPLIWRVAVGLEYCTPDAGWGFEPGMQYSSPTDLTAVLIGEVFCLYFM